MFEKDDFIIVNKIKYLIKYSNDYIFPSFPKVHLALKINFEKSLYLLLEESIRARINTGNIRIKHIREMLVNVYLLDYYIGEIYDKKIILTKRYNSFINGLGELSKMVNGWINNEEKRKSV